MPHSVDLIAHRADHRAVGGHEQVEPLHHIEEDLVLAVLDALNDLVIVIAPIVILILDIV